MSREGNGTSQARATLLVGLRGHEALLDGVVVQRVVGQTVQPGRAQFHPPAAWKLWCGRTSFV